jgi:hypothetical protein
VTQEALGLDVGPAVRAADDVGQRAVTDVVRQRAVDETADT